MARPEVAPCRSRLIALATALAVSSPAARAADAPAPETVVVNSGVLALRALLWRPAGPGPFPAVLFNHGSGRGRATEAGRRDQRTFEEQAAALGPVFARHGYAFLFLFRRGAGPSAGQGTYGGDVMDRALATNGQEGRNEAQLRLLETHELADALAGLAFLRAVRGVDARRVAIAGHSFGGSLTLLAAERDGAVRGIVDFAGAAYSWERSSPLRARLLAAVAHAPAPVFLIHAENDYSVAPGRALAAELARRGKPHLLKIYPRVGTTPDEGHNFVHLRVATWEADVFAFLDECTRR